MANCFEHLQPDTFYTLCLQLRASDLTNLASICNYRVDERLWHFWMRSQRSDLLPYSVSSLMDRKSDVLWSERYASIFSSVERDRINVSNRSVEYNRKVMDVHLPQVGGQFHDSQKTQQCSRNLLFVEVANRALCIFKYDQKSIKWRSGPKIAISHNVGCQFCHFTAEHNELLNNICFC